MEVSRIKAIPNESTESQLVNPQQQSNEIECDLSDTEINHGNQDSTGNTPQNQHGERSPAEEVDDDQETLESEKILFADSLFKYLDKRTERGKTNFKWDGKPTELHDFITLVLKRNGQMKSRKAGGGKQMHFFQDKPANVTINFWQTSKTLSIQGNESITKKIIDKLERIVKEMKPESAAKTSNANANDEIPQTKASTPKKTKKKKITTDEELVISKSQLEPPLNRNPSDDIAKLWEAINEMKSLLLKSWTTNTSIREASVAEPQGTSLHNRIKHLEDDKIKLTDELEQARALNMELLRMINSQPFNDTEGVNYKAKINRLEAELTHTKALNKELIELLNKKNNCRPTETEAANQQKHQEADQVEKTTQTQKKKQPQQHQTKQQAKGKQQGQARPEDGKKDQEYQGNSKEKVEKPREKRNSKPSIIIAGDSMVKNIKGWLMSRKKHVRVYSFPGATTDEMESFVKPLIARQPDEIIIHIGTNDLSRTSAGQVTDNILKLAAEVKKHGIKCSISSLITRKGELNDKVKQVNAKLAKAIKTDTSIKLICNNNITLNHLNNGGLHLNKRGDGALALNLINHIRD